MAVSVITQSYDTRDTGDWILSNNTWGEGTLVNGTDYTQTISYDPAIGIGSTDIEWSWPDGGRVMAFPSVVAGWSPWGEFGNRDLAVQLGDLRALDLRFDLDLVGDHDNYNVCLDLWLTDKRGGNAEAITHEILFTLHDPVGLWEGADGRIDDPVSGYGADWMVSTRVEPGYTWEFVYAAIDVDMLTGRIDLGGLLDQLVAAGIMGEDVWLTGIELGAEVYRGDGGLSINALDYTLTTYAATAGADTLRGTVRADRIEGEGGNDILIGQERGDLLRGGAGDDRLRGDAGQDILWGGAGRDVLAGGIGADRFVFAPQAQATLDRITDFTHSDVIDFRPLDADLVWRGSQGLAGGGTASLTWASNPNGIALLVDSSGDGRADLRVLLSGVAALSQGDVLL